MEPESSNDLQHLRLLSIFHYVVAGLTVFYCLFLLGYSIMAAVMATGRLDTQNEGATETFGWFLLSISTFSFVLALAFLVCLVLAGRYLRRHRNHTFCMVTAGLACLFFPFGTVLGVFTIVVLMRPSVKALFESDSAERNLATPAS